MCLLLVKPAGVELKDIENLCKMATDANPDGFGVAYRGEKRIGLFRGMSKPEQQTNILSKIGKRAAIVHWRFSTGGTKTIHNCHPFRLTDGTVFAHNGIFPINSTQTQSDTRIVAENSKDLDELLFHVEPFIGIKNKIAYLQESSENPVILGENAGEWSDEVWYSNTYWKYSHASTYYGDCDDYWSSSISNDLSSKLRPLIARYGIDGVLDEAYRIDKEFSSLRDYD